MNRVKELLGITLILSVCICIGCSKNSDSTYFNGEIRCVEDSVKKIKKIRLKSVSLEGENFGWISVYDSLMFFFNPKLPDRYYNIFNINTGEELGTFCNKGGGPEEVVAVGPIYQFFKKDNELKTILFAVNEERLLIWNITQSIKQGKTVMDRVIPYTWRTENGGACYNEIFLQDENTLLAKVEASPISDEASTLPIFQKRTLDTNKCLKSYSIYNRSMKNEKASIGSEDFFYSNDYLKPDGTKIVQAMLHLPQLNIIDVQTGKVVGYRLGDDMDFSVLEQQKEIKNYYGRLQVDDNYIYVLYWGKTLWEDLNTIYVFDWNGQLVRKIATDQAIDKMWVDTVRNRLYTTTPTTDEVFYCDLNEIWE